jgi:hypothetical protein
MPERPKNKPAITMGFAGQFPHAHHAAEAQYSGETLEHGRTIAVVLASLVVVGVVFPLGHGNNVRGRLCNASRSFPHPKTLGQNFLPPNSTPKTSQAFVAFCGYLPVSRFHVGLPEICS